MTSLRTHPDVLPLIDGQLRAGRCGATLPVHRPASGERVGSVARLRALKNGKARVEDKTEVLLGVEISDCLLDLLGRLECCNTVGDELAFSRADSGQAAGGFCGHG